MMVVRFAVAKVVALHAGAFGAMPEALHPGFTVTPWQDMGPRQRGERDADGRCQKQSGE